MKKIKSRLFISIALVLAAFLTFVNLPIIPVYASNGGSNVKSWNFSNEEQFEDFTAHQNHIDAGYYEKPVTDRFIWETHGDKKVLRSNGEAYTASGSKVFLLDTFTDYMNSLSLKNEYKNFIATVTFKDLSGKPGAVGIGFRETLPGKHSNAKSWDTLGVQGDGNFSGLVLLFNNHAIGATAGAKYGPTLVSGSDYAGSWMTIRLTVMDDKYTLEILNAQGTQLYANTASISTRLPAEGYVSFYSSYDTCISDITFEALSNTQSSGDILNPNENTTVWNFSNEEQFEDFTAHQNHIDAGYYEKPVTDRFVWETHGDKKILRSNGEAYTSSGSKVFLLDTFTDYMNSLSLKNEYKNFIATVTFKDLSGKPGAVGIGFRETLPGKHSNAKSWDTLGVQGDGNFSGLVLLFNNHAIGATAGAKYGPTLVSGSDYAGSWMTIRLTVIEDEYTLEIIDQTGNLLYTNTADICDKVSKEGYVSFYGSYDTCISRVTIEELPEVDKELLEWDFSNQEQLNDFTGYQNNVNLGYYKREVTDRFIYETREGKNVLRSSGQSINSEGESYWTLDYFTDFMNGLTLNSGTYRNFTATITFKDLSGKPGAVGIGFREAIPGKHTIASSWDTFGVQGDGNYSSFTALFNNHLVVASAGEKTGPNLVKGSDYAHQWTTIRLTVTDDEYKTEVLDEENNLLYSLVQNISLKVGNTGYVTFYASYDTCISNITFKELKEGISDSLEGNFSTWKPEREDLDFTFEKPKQISIIEWVYTDIISKK